MSAAKSPRFEVPLPPERYEQLGGLSERLGLCRRDVARLAIVRLLENPDQILGLTQSTET